MLFGLATGARAQPDGSVASNGRLPYRVEGPDRYKVMTLATDEFIRRFLTMACLRASTASDLSAKAACADNIARARQLLAKPQDQTASADATDVDEPPINRCPRCGGRMIIIERFKRGATPRHQPTAPTVSIRIDTS